MENCPDAHPNKPSEHVLLSPAALPACLQPTPQANPLLLAIIPLMWLKRKILSPGNRNPSIHPWSLSQSHRLQTTHSPSTVASSEGSASPMQIFSKGFQQKIPRIRLDGTVSWGQYEWLMGSLQNKTSSALSQDSCYGFLTPLSRNLLWLGGLEEGRNTKHTIENPPLYTGDHSEQNPVPV